MSCIEEAQARARRRKSRWNLLLIPAAALPMVVFWATVVLLAEQVHLSYFPGQSLRAGSGPWVVVAAVAPLFAAIPIGMLVGNFMVRHVRPAGIALDHEASSDPRLSYAGSKAALLKVALSAAVASLAATTLGVLSPW
jgi:hypothetical protein